MYNTPARFTCTLAVFPHLGGLFEAGRQYLLTRTHVSQYRVADGYDQRDWKVTAKFTMWNLEQAAEQCGVTKTIMREAVTRGQIPAIECDNRRVIIPDSALHGYRDDFLNPRMSCREYA